MDLEEFSYLDNESEDLLKELLHQESILNITIKGTAIEHLIRYSYVEGFDSKTCSDAEPVYILRGLTQKGKSYFELKRKHEATIRRFKRREWLIAIISAIIGAMLCGFFDHFSSIIQWFK